MSHEVKETPAHIDELLHQQFQQVQRLCEQAAAPDKACRYVDAAMVVALKTVYVLLPQELQDTLYPLFALYEEVWSSASPKKADDLPR